MDSRAEIRSGLPAVRRVVATTVPLTAQDHVEGFQLLVVRITLGRSVVS